MLINNSPWLSTWISHVWSLVDGNHRGAETRVQQTRHPRRTGHCKYFNSVARSVTDAGSQVSVSEDHLLQPAPHTALQDRVTSKLYGVTGKKKQRHQNRIWGYFPFKSIYFWLYKLLLVDITANCHRPVDQCEDQCKSWNYLPFWNTNADWHYFQGFDFS